MIDYAVNGIYIYIFFTIIRVKYVSNLPFVFTGLLVGTNDNETKLSSVNTTLYSYTKFTL